MLLDASSRCPFSSWLATLPRREIEEANVAEEHADEAKERIAWPSQGQLFGLGLLALKLRPDPDFAGRLNAPAKSMAETMSLFISLLIIGC